MLLIYLLRTHSGKIRIFAAVIKMKKTEFPYPLMSRESMISRMDELVAVESPFLFIVSYDMNSGYVIPANELDDSFVRFSFNNPLASESLQSDFNWKVTPVELEDYSARFSYVISQLQQGNSFLVNLTQPSEVQTNLSIDDIFDKAHAPYKLWVKDQFLVLSPESFIRISGNTISTFPMKGTIDAGIPDAENLILNDDKEKAEHATIVDLLRNDLSMVADNVVVSRYRYIERINTLQKDLLQVSSEISGVISAEFSNKPGSLLFKLLPAGSICGAPKARTLEIIREAEQYDRGFYTGVCGFFDGKNLDSAVMIRFMEPAESGLIFKSGGGITFRSEMEKEYEELIQKVYVPVC
jgi:para-aminobenzoate synthetase component I